MSHQPPRLADQLLRFFCAPDRLEEIQGDLYEEFTWQVEHVGEQRARWRYWRDVLSYFKPQTGGPFHIGPSLNEYTRLPHTAMLQNYLKIAFRNLTKSKSFSAINVLGLTLGLASSLLILLWIRDERSVDAFHAHKNQLYRIYMREYFSGKVQGVIWTPGPLAATLKREIPEIQYTTPYEWSSKQTFSVGPKVYKEMINAAGPDFFNMFSFKLLQGTPQTALNEMNSLAISRRMAEAFFGSPEAAIGQSIRYDNRLDLLVTAVFENLPANSTLQFDCLRSWDAYVADGNEWAKGWGSTDPLTFFMIRPDANPANVAAKISHLLDKYNRDGGRSTRTELAMQPFHDYYLNSTFKEAQIDGGRIEYVRLFTIVAVCILLIACVNFMNLATARSAKRAKEVGVRKVVGAMRSLLIGQFIGEAMLLTIVSVLLAVLLVCLVLPFFNTLTSKLIVLPIREPIFWTGLLGLTVLTGVVAGSYPAFFLSSLHPIRVLKGTLTFDAKSTWLRQGLVVFQFALSVLLIVGTIVIYKQVNYVQTKNLGYNRQNLVYFPLEGKLTSTFALLKKQLSDLPGVTQVSYMTAEPASNGSGTSGISWPGSDPSANIRFTEVGVGYDFVKAMQLKLRYGRDFSEAYSTDSTGFLINEAALKVIGYKQPIGKPLTWGERTGTIVGVLADFHFQSLHTPIRPLIGYLRNRQLAGNVLVRINPDKLTETLTQLGDICQKLNTIFPFTYAFTDQEYARQYAGEQVVSQLANYFAFLAIFIASLGLFGLATFTAEQRTKEIGVRKVLGASVGSLVGLLSKDFLKLVGMAIVLASPLAWWAMHRWLQSFAYKIDLAWWMFASAGVLAIVIALLATGFQSIRAALLNPVKSLRSE